jgi:hypothetical protein
MEGVVANSIRVHGRSNSRKFGNGLIQWTSVPIGAASLSHCFPIIQRSKFFKVYKKFCHDVTLSLLLYIVLFWPCKDIKWMRLMESHSGLKYGTYKMFDTFWLININGDQNIGQKRTPLRTRYFLFLVVHLKEFEPSNVYHLILFMLKLELVPQPQVPLSTFIFLNKKINSLLPQNQLTHLEMEHV